MNDSPHDHARPDIADMRAALATARAILALNVPGSASAWRPSGLSVADEPGPGATSDQVCEAVGSRRRGLLVAGGCTYDLYAAVRWKVVPTLFWMKEPGRRRAIAWVAFQPVQ